jgi:hypothetical protein
MSFAECLFFPQTQVEMSSNELSSIEAEMQTLDETHKKTASDVETTMLSLETTSEQVRCQFQALGLFTA